MCFMCVCVCVYICVCVCVCVYKPGVGNGNLFQYSCLKNSMDRGVWWVTVHGVAELNMTEHPHTHMKSLDTVVPSGVCVLSHFSLV